MKKSITILILCIMLVTSFTGIFSMQTSVADPTINFKVGIYNVDSSGRAVGFVELGDYGLPDPYILNVKDLDTGDKLHEFCQTGAPSNWDKITNVSSNPIQYYPNIMDMYALFGNPNWQGTYLGMGVMGSPWEIKYISNTPITRDNFLVQIKPWTGYGAEGSQSRGLYFDYVDMDQTYLVRINGDSNYILEDLSSNTVLASGSFSGDNYNPNMDIFLEVSNITDITMHVKTYTTISPAPYERLFFEGDLLRQGLPVPPENVYVDDDYSSSTPGWGYDHFSSIQDGIDAVGFDGTIFVSSGLYYENLLIEKNYLKIYGEDKNNTIIDANSAGNVITIQNQENNEYNGKYNFISGFTLRNAGGDGVYIHDVGRHGPPHPEYNTIINCLIYSCMGSGVHLYSDHEGMPSNSFLNCHIFNNSGYGVYFHGRFQNADVISGCQIFNNQQGGILLEGSSYNWGYSGQHIVRNNSCYNNNGAGLSITADNFGIIVYHNNFLNNSQNANDNCNNIWYPATKNNTWYNTTLLEGNYWSDYSGEDTNGDGIGDTPYSISGGSSQDLYPFMQENGWLLPTPPNQLPVADAGGPYYANVGNSITFNASGSSDTDGTIVGYRWDWTNDGTYDTDWLTSVTTTHSYPSAGTFTVKLEVKDNASGTDTDTATAYITAESGAVPTADVNGPYTGYVNQPVSFSSAGSVGGSEGTITEWYWTFGDGAVSSQQNPSHTYTSAGTFTVTLKVTNNFGQTNTDTTSATIQELSPDQILPVADAGGPYSGVVGTPITFDGSGSTDADGTIVSYVWNFGDSTTGTGVSPTHTYTIPGNYTVILTVTDNESLTHSNSTTANINVSGPPTIVISVDISNIEPIEEENEKTIPITVYCYHQTVSNIHLEILEDSNLTVTLLSPNVTLNPGESRELLINVKAPKLDLKGKEKVGDETIKLRAVGDGNVTSNTEQMNIKVVQKGATPGFELVFALCAIGVAILLWRNKRK